jgi:antitoxin component YwqK of YwqJK toxin-antitoxin module
MGTEYPGNPKKFDKNTCHNCWTDNSHFIDINDDIPNINDDITLTTGTKSCSLSATLLRNSTIKTTLDFDNNTLQFVVEFNSGATKFPYSEVITISTGRLEVGKFVFYDDTKVGTIIASREFNSKDNSCYTIFFNQKGNKVSEGKLVNKLLEGEWKYYHENATTIMTSEFYVKGKLEGVKKVFYSNQKIAEETTFKNGLKNGPYKKYAKNGIVFEESNYKNDEFDGPAIFRNDANVVVSKGVYKNGKKVGMWEITTKGKTEQVNMNFPKQIKIKKKPITEEPN